MPTAEETLKKREAAREVIDTLQEMATLLVYDKVTSKTDTRLISIRIRS
jgi:hypothetical protein